MLRFLRNLLGWDSHAVSSNPAGIERRRTPRTSAASVLANGPPNAAEPKKPKKTKKAEKAAEPELSLKGPEIGPENPDPDPDADRSDPYDTGQFNNLNVWSNKGGRRNN